MPAPGALQQEKGCEFKASPGLQWDTVSQTQKTGFVFLRGSVYHLQGCRQRICQLELDQLARYMCEQAFSKSTELIIKQTLTRWFVHGVQKEGREELHPNSKLLLEEGALYRSNLCYFQTSHRKRCLHFLLLGCWTMLREAGHRYRSLSLDIRTASSTWHSFSVTTPSGCWEARLQTVSCWSLKLSSMTSLNPSPHLVIFPILQPIIFLWFPRSNVSLVVFIYSLLWGVFKFCFKMTLIDIVCMSGCLCVCMALMKKPEEWC